MLMSPRACLPKNASLEELQNFFYEQGPAVSSTFQPVNGGFDRACRGANIGDNRASNYRVVALQSLADCEQKCLDSHGCVAVEYSKGRCELWLKKVEATLSFQCQSVVPGTGSSWVFEAVDGAQAKVCRGSHPGDNSNSYFELSSASNITDCLTKCFETSLCTGVEFHKTGRCELWNRTIGASNSIDGYQCYRLVKKPNNRGCTFPACAPCRTAQPGEDCYSDVIWAMRDGIYSQPQWYPGLTPSSSFEEFQQLFYETGVARCHEAPCPPTTATTTSTTTEQTGPCQDVWEAEARDPWSVATCGSRIEQYSREGLTDQEAKAKVGLFYTACEACWPWPKYKDPTDNRHGLHFIPMVWGTGQARLDKALEDGLPRGKRALLGFNEPNFPERPLWLTEFACSEASSVERLPAEGQMAYMREAIPLLEHEDSIEMYAWPLGNLPTNGKNPIVAIGNGTLSALGELYASFTGPRLVGEECYEAVLWAMTNGVVTNPEWYGGLTVESSFEDFQTFFFKEGTLNGVCAAPACPGCHTAVRDEQCYADVKWAMERGIPEHPDTREWYDGLTTESSFEEVQEYFWREGVKSDCKRPCAPLCSSTGNCSAMGVNVFGFDGFEDEASVKRAVQKLFQKGIRHFRVVNVGAWADVALTAINEAAGVYPGSSVKITNLFFDSPSICQDAELYCVNPTEQGFGQQEPKAEAFRTFIQQQYGQMIQEAHKAFPADVEFVIPFQNERASPRALLDHLIVQYVQPLRTQGRKFHIEGTLYPFWTSTVQAFAPFDTSTATWYGLAALPRKAWVCALR
eukprot:Skav203906  [mRNA]  locus=scaffold1649:333420:346789:- [translate_table: standard]